MARKDEIYEPALMDKKIPILTLDNKWHKLFTQVKPDKQIVKLEAEINNLLKKQGKAGTELKSLRKLKKKLLDEIMEHAEDASGGKDKKAEKKMDENKRLINECNEKIAAYEEDLIEIPKEIDKVNKALMIRTMEICYITMQRNKVEIDLATEWIEKTRIELKERLVDKQEKEQMNDNLYAYMHDIFGAEVINIFDAEFLKKNKE